MDEKTKMVLGLFQESAIENAPDVPTNAPIREGTYYGGRYNGRKYMYSKVMIDTMPADKLEAFIKKQIGI